MADKDEILQAIRLQAAKNGGVPLGKDKFAKATGIGTSAWYGKYWVKWNDAILEAGFEPNNWNVGFHEKKVLVSMLADFTRELGHYPVGAERNMRNRGDKSFPMDKIFAQHLGNRQQQLRLLIEFAVENSEYKDVYDICAPLVNLQPDGAIPGNQNSSRPGRVYILRSGNKFKIGKTDDLKRRKRDLQTLVPNKLELIHELETDDPAGIELYWHRRFKNKRQDGEWFDLDASDIAAFKSRGKSM